MKRIATIIQDGRVVGVVHGPDVTGQTIKVNGRIWRFDFDECFGPLWFKADGYTPRKNQNPGRKVWKAWEAWHKRYIARTKRPPRKTIP